MRPLGCFDRNGTSTIMLYNRYSYRQWFRWPIITGNALIKELFLNKKGPKSTEEQRKSYDAGLNGNAAPETDFFSSKEILKMFERFSQIKIQKENCDFLGIPKYKICISRDKLLPLLGKKAGLDYYIKAVK